MSRLLILGWHAIEPTGSFPGLSPQACRRGFQRQLRTLRRWANVVPLRSAVADLADGRPLPPRAVSLTFDDGYLDNLTVAAPMLTAAGLPATFFLVPGILSGEVRAWWEELGSAFVRASAAELRWGGERYDTSSPRARQTASAAVTEVLKSLDSSRRWDAIGELRGRLAPVGENRTRQFMNWDDAKALLGHGHDIGSHTWQHPILSREEPPTQVRELVGSRSALSEHLDRPVDMLAFPNGRPGDYSTETLRLTRDAGYAFAFAARAGLAGPGTACHEVPRVMLGPQTDVLEVLRRAARAARRTRPSLASRRHPPGEPRRETADGSGR